MTQDSQHIDNLIAKHLAGEASQEEQLQLRQWMDASPENKKYFGDIQFVHDKTVASHKYQKVNTNSAWDKLHAQMKHNSPPEIAKPTITLPLYKQTWFRVAASVFIIIGISIYFYLSQNNNTLPQTLAITSTDSIIEQTLPDNSRVVLNRNSKLTFAYNASKKQKEITLTGEAFFDVKHSADTSLIVKAGETLIRDIGTSFSIKAFPDKQTVEVYVESGEIEFFTAENKGVHLYKGEVGIYTKTLKTFTKQIAETPNPIAFKTKVFVFNATRLSDVIAALNEVYPVPIALDNPNLGNCLITVSFDNEPIDSVIAIISETLGLLIQNTENGYTLLGETCITQ